MSLEKLMMKHERLVMVNDIHVPFHDEKTLESVKYGLKYMKPDRLILGGDIIDFYSISHFDKDPSRALHLEEEINNTYDVLNDILSVLPKKCKVSYLLGNHEERLQKYVHSNAPELHWVDGLKWNQMLGLHELGIRAVNKRWMEYKGVMYSHLNRANKYGGYTAKNLGTDFNRTIVHTHTHKTGHVRHGEMDFYDNGCLCDLQPEYMSGSGPSVWSQAFMVVDYLKEGPHFTQIPISGHQFVYDGRLFTPEGMKKIPK
jgi:predicted MPP superfamily phosphohydrolase